MENNKNPPDPLAIVNILTLRYNPTIKPIITKLDWRDFIPTNLEPSLDFIESALQNPIKNQLKNEDSVSIALSGGVDSTLVFTMLRKTLPDLKVNAISIKFADSVDETPLAARIAEELNAKHHIVKLDNYLSELPQAISIIGMPFWDLHWYYVTKKAKTLSNHLLAGDGGDEVFGGYTFRYKKFLSLTNPNSKSLEKVKAYLECHERDRVPDQKALFGNKTSFSWTTIYDQLIQYFDNTLDPLDQVFLADFNGKLMYNFLPINTALHNHFGLTAIAPILSQEIISYATHIPHNLKYDESTDTGKILLRKLLERHKMHEFVNKEKLGFNVNTINLWKSYGKKLCNRFLTDGRIIQDGWIKQEWVSKYLDNDNLDVKYVNKFLGLLALEIWYRIFITKEMNKQTMLI